ncbi:MAG: hypothetical protein AB7P40_18665 [Chloroflexota bacterium]
MTAFQPRPIVEELVARMERPHIGDDRDEYPGVSPPESEGHRL